MSDSELSPRKIAVLYYFGDFSYWKLPDVAAEALAVGFDGIALRNLAELTNIVESDLIPTHIDAAFREMGIDAPIPKDVARLVLATESVGRALSGESNVFDEATHIRIHLCELNNPPPDLHRIVDLARQSRSAPRSTWKALEVDLGTAMSQFLRNQSHPSDTTRR